MRLKFMQRPFAVFLTALLVPNGGFARLRKTPEPQKELTVSAAISLKDALDEIAKLYGTEAPGTVIHFNLGASGTLQRQAEQGAPVDIFISASEDQMDSLESRGLVLAGTRRNLVKNTVVLVIPKAGSVISSFQDLARPEVKHIAIGEPGTVPAGKYAQEVLTHFKFYEQLKPKFVLGKDVRQVLTYVVTGNVDAGIVYATDAQTSAEVRVVATAPEDSHSPVNYPAAALKGSKEPAEAKRFLEFLVGARAQEVFEKYGFKPADQRKIAATRSD
jgi:molybdate transport system substrate-binding protein